MPPPPANAEQIEELIMAVLEHRDSTNKHTEVTARLVDLFEHSERDSRERHQETERQASQRHKQQMWLGALTLLAAVAAVVATVWLG